MLQDEVNRLQRLLVREKVFRSKQDIEYQRLLVDYHESMANNSRLKRSIGLLETEYKNKRQGFERERSHLLHFWNLSNRNKNEASALNTELNLMRKEFGILCENAVSSRERVSDLITLTDQLRAEIIHMEVLKNRLLKVDRSLQREVVIRELKFKNLKKQAEESITLYKIEQQRYSRLQSIVAPLLSNLLTSTERQYFLNGDKTVSESLKQRMRNRLSLTDEKSTLDRLSSKRGSKFLSSGLNLETQNLPPKVCQEEKKLTGSS